LAETVNGLYKTELIRGPVQAGRPWKTVDDVELATLGWVHWHNTERLHRYLGDVPPAEFEAAHLDTNKRASLCGPVSAETDRPPTIIAAQSALHGG
jgi:putative transposase